MNGLSSSCCSTGSIVGIWLFEDDGTEEFAMADASTAINGGGVEEDDDDVWDAWWGGGNAPAISMAR